MKIDQQKLDEINQKLSYAPPCPICEGTPYYDIEKSAIICNKCGLTVPLVKPGYSAPYILRKWELKLRIEDYKKNPEPKKSDFNSNLSSSKDFIGYDAYGSSYVSSLVRRYMEDEKDYLERGLYTNDLIDQ